MGGRVRLQGIVADAGLGSRWTRSECRIDTAFRLGISLALLGLVGLTFINPWVFTADDSLFYVVVAKHISAEGAWTFNGLMPTNGVQPLWQLVTAGVVTVADLLGIESPASLVRAVFVVNWALALFALAQMWRLLGRLGVGDPYRWCGVVLLGGCLCGPWGLFASEGHVVAVTLLWLLLTVDRWFSEGPRVGIALVAGVANGLMMLARLDTVWVAGTAIACMLLVPSGCAVGARLRSSVVAAATATAIVLPYLAWNVARFGHVSPISGAIKVDVTSPHISVDGIGLFGVAILVAIWAGGLLGVLRRPRQKGRVAVWLIPCLGATMSSAFYVVFSRGTFTQWYWYFMPHGVGLALTVSLLADRLVEDRPRISARAAVVTRLSITALAVLALAFCAVRYVYGPPSTLWAEARAFSSEVSEVLPEGAAVATVDMPGVLGLVSGHPVLALDGLTGDYAFQDSLRDKGVSCTLDDLGVEYVVTVYERRIVERTSQSVRLAIYSWLHFGGLTELRGRGPLVVSRSGDYQLWRLDAGCELPT